MLKKLFLIVVSAGLLLWSNGLASSQDQFYRGKLLRILVGFPPGGGYDTYTRLLARHWGKHIPGNPTIVVDNMSGAGSMISANHIYKVAKPDGLTVGHFIGGLFLQQLLGKPGIEFDARKFEYVGAPAQDVFIIGVSKASGITSPDYSRQNCDRGATLPERRQSSCALKMRAGRVAYEISSEKVKHRAERRAQNETFAPVPSFLQGHTSINGVSSGFLVA